VNKRINSLTLFVVGTLLLGLLGAVTALAAPSGATTGSVVFDKAWYTTGALGSGSAVKVTVTDADANVTVASSTTVSLLETNLNPALGTQAVTVTMPSGDEVVGTPYWLDASKTDCTVATDKDEDLTNTVADATAASIIVQSFGGLITVDQTRTICFDQGKKDTLTVKVWSTQTGESGALSLSATETGVSTGKFEATVTLINTATSVTTHLHALNLNGLSSQYTDTTPSSGTSVKVSASSQVETSKPVSTNLAPITAFATQATQPEFTGTITDSGAGLDVSTIVIGIDTDDGGTIDADEKFTPTVTGADGDVQVTWKYTTTALPEGDIDWQVEVTDMAGNTSLSDSDGDTAGSQVHVVRIDKTPPSISSAKTGNYWDSVTSTTKANKATSIEVLFNENLDAASVSAADFTVDAVSPTAADVYTKKPASVFLTVGADILADGTPTVALAAAGAVSDKAGNALNVGSKKTTDTIAPTFTVTVDKTLTKDTATVSITSDEKISGVPVVEIWKDDSDPSAEKTLSVVVKTLTSWTASFTTISGSDGKKAIYVTGSDLAVPGNAGTKGSKDPAATTAITFTQDTTAPTVAFDPDGATDVTSSSPFVKANYTDANKVTLTKAEFGLSTVTGADVLASMFSSDQKQHIYAASGLVVGSSYKLKLSGEDAAGNKLADQSVTFKIAARPKISITLVPGHNLVSLPGAPADSAINSVGLPTEVKSVLSYDGGKWLVATKGADGKLAGTLTTFDSNHAYWVETTSSAPLKVDVPAQAFQATPPSIAVVNGWNLLPVSSVSGAAIGTEISSDTYFGSTSWITAYWFDTASDAWVKVLPKQVPADKVKVGNGYWVYITADGVLVP